MKTITMRQLWDKFASEGLLGDGLETGHELALQRLAFCCGAMAAMGNLALGRRLDPGTADEFLLDACAGLMMEADAALAREPYQAASAN